MADCSELLFFDTFSHENSEELNLDLVQFPKPVFISEVRIIPLGARVQADFPGGVRLGATNPSQFQIEFFVNDLSKPGASTFESLGALEYRQNGNIQLECDRRIPTDGLVLRGWYSTITLAVYGVLTKSVQETAAAPPPTPAVSIGVSKGPPPPAHPLPLPHPHSHPHPLPPHTRHPPNEPRLLGDVSGPPPIQSGDWASSHTPVSEGAVEATRFPLEGVMGADPRGDNYSDSYSSSRGPPPHPPPHHPPQEYRPSYQEEWNPQSQVPGSHSSEPYDRSKNPGGSFEEEKLPWERMKDDRERGREREWEREKERKERNSRERDYGRDRDRDRDWDREHDKEKEQDRDRERDRDRDRDWPPHDHERPKDHDWDRGRDRDRFRDSERDRSLDRDAEDWDHSQPTPPPQGPPSLLQLQLQPPPQRRNWPRPRPHDLPPPQGPSPPITLPLPLPLLPLPLSLPLPLPLDRGWDNRPREGSTEREERKRPRSPPAPRSPERKSPPPPPSTQTQQPLLPLPLTLPLPLPLPLQTPLLATPVMPRAEEGGKGGRTGGGGEAVTGETGVQQDESKDGDKGLFPLLSPGGMEDISDGEIPEAEPASEGEDEVASAPPKPEEQVEAEKEPEKDAPPEMEEFEEIVSDEDIVDEVQDGEMDYENGDYWEEFQAKTFNPYNWEAQALSYFCDPSLTSYEVELPKLAHQTDSSNPSEDSEKLLEILGRFSSSNEDWGERWVESMEQLPRISSQGLATCAPEEKEKVEDILVTWACKGMDFELAIKQPQAAFKIRHLKAGVKLVQAMCSYGERLLKKLLAQDIQSQLLCLYHKEYMALSIKLMIIRALDATIHTKDGMEMFLGLTTEDSVKVKLEHNIDRTSVKSESSSQTAYKHVTQLLLGKEPSRAKFALTALIQRVHLFELMVKLRNLVTGLAQAHPPSETVSEDREGTPKAEGEGNSSGGGGNQDMAEVELEAIIACLDEILRIYTNAGVVLSQPQRFLPVSVQFELPTANAETMQSIYNMFRKQQLLESILMLLTCPPTASHPNLLAAIQELLQALLQTQEGMLFLLAQPEVAMSLARALLPPIPGEEGRGEEVLGPEEASQLQHIGLHLVHCLQVLSWVDTLLDLTGQNGCESEEQEVLEVLQGLYHLLFSQPGRQALAHVLSRDNNLNALLPFVRSSGDEEVDAKMKKSASRGYAVDLLILVVKHSDHAPFLQRYGETLLQICRQDESAKLRDLLPWLSITENPEHFIHEGIPNLCEIIKRNMEEAVNLPGELIMAVRMLQHLGIPPPGHHTSEDHEFTELKYKYSVTQLLSCDGLANFIAILQQLCAAYEQPALHTATFVGPQGFLLTALILPIIKLTRRMLTYVIRYRNTEFRDLTAVPILLQVYVFMHAFPSAAIAYNQAQEVCQEVVLTLLAYTQPVLDASDSEDALNKSLWTQMVNEVLKFVTSAPYRFIPSLLVMSEMLPLPLPIHTKQALAEEECHRAVHGRKLWSAHLLPLASPIQELIARLSGSSFQPLLQLLRRVCVQLADLAAPAALVVCRAVLDTVFSSLESDHKASGEGGGDSCCSGHTARLLNFLACLVSHASVKVGVLHLCRGGNKSEEKYLEFLPALNGILLASSQQAPSHVQAQECVVSILQCLCDTEISLLVFDPATSGSVEAYLANSLPAREQLLQMCNSLLEHVSNLEHSFTTLLPTLRTLVMFTEHDYGFFHLKSCLEKRPGALPALFSKMSFSFSKDSSDCLSTLSTALELLRLLLAPEGEDDVASTGLSLPPRAGSLSPAELAAVLQWGGHRETVGDGSAGGTVSKEEVEDSESTEGKEVEAAKEVGNGESQRKHPILLLEKQLQEWSSEEEAMESLAEQVSSLVRLLEDEGSRLVEGPATECVEPLLPAADPLTVQFSTRPVFMISDGDEERLGAGFWLSPPPVDEADQDGEQVACDLLELSHDYLGDWDLICVARQLCKPRDEWGERTRSGVSGGVGLGMSGGGGSGGGGSRGEEERERGERERGRERDRERGGERDRGGDRERDRDREKTLIVPPKEIKAKKPFMNSNRARGFGRPPPSSRSDPFRSRPPNTSRPPSLHVDDFIKLESAGQQPTGPTGYNKMSMRAAKELIASRSSSSRGRGFGSERGGRFFGGRRESVREVAFGRGATTTITSPAPSSATAAIPSLWAALRAAETSSLSSTGRSSLSSSFRTPPEARERAPMPRSEDKFGSRGWGSGGGGRGKERERRGGGGGARRDGRHTRAFTR